MSKEQSSAKGNAEFTKAETVTDETQKGDTVLPGGIKRMKVMCRLSESELAERGTELAAAMDEIVHQQLIVKHAKVKIKSAVEKTESLTGVIVNKQELREMDCPVELHYDDPPQAVVKHPITGEVVFTRLLTDDERTPELPGMSESLPSAASSEPEPDVSGEEEQEPEDASPPEPEPAPETAGPETQEVDPPSPVVPEPDTEVEPQEGNTEEQLAGLPDVNIDEAGWTSELVVDTGGGLVHCFAGTTESLCGKAECTLDAALLESEFFLDAQLCPECLKIKQGLEG